MFRTGDIGYQDSDGYFDILDRLKDMVDTSGENIHPGDVEAVIYEHPAVSGNVFFYRMLMTPQDDFASVIAASFSVPQSMFLHQPCEEW
jgi:acyl-CoA synthetase (AMP-forming)/AMP-acid ligase II